MSKSSRVLGLALVALPTLIYACSSDPDSNPFVAPANDSGSPPSSHFDASEPEDSSVLTDSSMAEDASDAALDASDAADAAPAGPLPARTLSSNFWSTCAVSAAGGVSCWGYGMSGRLGNGLLTDSATAVNVTGLASGAVEISVGSAHACARKTGGSVVCWGYNGNGQIGDTTKTNRLAPTAVSGLADAVEISAGAAHTCARQTAGTVVCWGANTYGQLGNNSTTDSATPVAVKNITDAVEISAGQAHTCARRANGAVVCWGANAYGQLGDGTKTDRATATPVSGLANAAALASGFMHSCALATDHTAKCWGDNTWSQLGDGTTTAHTAPAAVTGITDAVEIAGTCVRNAAGAVKCWGYNGAGEVGDGTFVDRTTPVAVTAVASATAISSGLEFACAAKSGGGFACWGGNTVGQLGNGTMKGGGATAALHLTPDHGNNTDNPFTTFAAMTTCPPDFIAGGVGSAGFAVFDTPAQANLASFVSDSLVPDLGKPISAAAGDGSQPDNLIRSGIVTAPGDYYVSLDCADPTFTYGVSPAGAWIHYDTNTWKIDAPGFSPP